MKLRTRLFIQSIAVIAATVAITIVAGLIYGYFYEKQTKQPAAGISEKSLVAVMRDGKVLYSSEGLSPTQIKSLMMETEMGRKTVDIDGVRYAVSTEKASAENLTVMRINPIIDLSGYYKNLLIVIITAFIIAFTAANIVVSRYNDKYIITPITELTRSTDKLSGGELDTVVSCGGTGETGRLGDAIERLRIKLKESVYYQEKYDENRKFLISGISHDLRTPITSVRGYIEGVLDGVADTEEKKEKYLKAALNKTDTIKIMIDDLLLYSKLDLNRLPFNFETVSIVKYLKECAADNVYSYARNGKRLEYTGGVDENVKVNIDAVRFKRVIQNILDNAEKNVENNTGVIKIGTRENNASVIIEIKDNGKGIKKEELPNIFNRFYRGDSARKTEGSSGLGLTIAKQLVEGMGGLIWASSEEGVGTSILISLKKVM